MAASRVTLDGCGENLSAIFQMHLTSPETQAVVRATPAARASLPFSAAESCRGLPSSQPGALSGPATPIKPRFRVRSLVRLGFRCPAPSGQRQRARTTGPTQTSCLSSGKLAGRDHACNGWEKVTRTPTREGALCTLQSSVSERRQQDPPSGPQRAVSATPTAWCCRVSHEDAVKRR